MNARVIVIVGSIAAMVIAVLAGLHWNRQTVPVNDEVPGTIAIAVVGLIVGILLGAISRLSVMQSAAIVGLGLAAGALLDAVIHFFVPPEAANLFPLVVIALGIIGCVVGMIGGLAGRGIVLLLESFKSGNGT